MLKQMLTTGRRLAVMTIATLTFTSLGCQTVGDPSCAIQHELCTDRHHDALYCPDYDPQHLAETMWFQCPTGWTAACPTVCQCRTSVRSTADAATVFAVPEKRTPREQPNSNDQ